MAIELKEKEKNLLMQSFAYGEENKNTNDAAGAQQFAQANQPVSNKTHVFVYSYLYLDDP